MKTNKELRREARIKLLGNYGTVVGAYIIFTMILNVISVPFSLFSNQISLMGLPYLGLGMIISIPVSLILTFLSAIFVAGVNKISFDIAHDRRGEFSDIFFCFSHNPLTVVCMTLWILLFILPAVIIFSAGVAAFTVMTVLSGDNLIIPASAILIIASIVYIVWLTVVSLGVSMAYFIYYENPDMKAIDLIKGSFAMMKGNKFRLFTLYFSYIGYYILGILSCGLALLWVNPNITVATVLFYEELKPGTASVINEEPPLYRSGSETVYHQEYWN